MKRWLAGVAVAVPLVLVACSGEDDDEATDTTAQTTSTTARTTTTRPSSTTTTTLPATSVAGTTFDVSASDVIDQINLQLPIVVSGEPTSALGLDQVGDSVWGGAVTPDTWVYVASEGNVFDDVRYVTVRVDSDATGAFQTPARLLASVGASLYRLSVEALEAFNADALPNLGQVDQRRTVLTVGDLYDLTVYVPAGDTSLVFVYTPVGEEAPTEALDPS